MPGKPHLHRLDRWSSSIDTLIYKLMPRSFFLLRACLLPFLSQFWFGPYLGAVGASLVYNYLFLHENAIKEAEEREAAAAAAAAAALPQYVSQQPASAFKPAPETVEAVPAVVPATPSQEWR